jgi:hypothetical protein
MENIMRKENASLYVSVHNEAKEKMILVFAGYCRAKQKSRLPKYFPKSRGCYLWLSRIALRLRSKTV